MFCRSSLCLQEICDEDALCTLPTGFCEDIDAVFRGESMKELQPTAQNGIIDETALSFHETSEPVGSPLQVFRVLNFNPAGAKLLPSPLQRQRGDHIAIAPYVITAREGDRTTSPTLLITISLCRDPSAQPKLLSMSSFMSLDFAKMFEAFLKCNLGK